MQMTPSTPRRSVLWALPRWVRWLAIVVVVLGALWASLTQEPMRAAIWQQISQRCGAIEVRDTSAPQSLITDPATARQAEECFMNGYAHCQAVSLDYTLSGIDYSTTNTFVVEPTEGRLAGCTLADALRTSIAGSGHTYTETDRCARVAQQPDGLHVLGCGSLGDIVIPSS